MDSLRDEYNLLISTINSSYVNNNKKNTGIVTNLIDKCYFIDVISNDDKKETLVGFYDDTINKKTIMVNSYVSIDNIIESNKKYRIANNVNIIDKLCDIKLNIEDKLKLDNFNDLNEIINNIISKYIRLSDRKIHMQQKIDDIKNEIIKENHRFKKITSDIIKLEKKTDKNFKDVNASNTIIKYYKKYNNKNKLNTSRIKENNLKDKQIVSDSKDVKKPTYKEIVSDNSKELKNTTYKDVGLDDKVEEKTIDKTSGTSNNFNFYFSMYQDKLNLLKEKNIIIPTNIKDILDETFKSINKLESEILNIISILDNKIDIDKLFNYKKKNFSLEYCLKLYKKNFISKETIIDIITISNIKKVSNIEIMLDLYKANTISEYYFFKKFLEI